jgi:hypothetical protein
MLPPFYFYWKIGQCETSATDRLTYWIGSKSKPIHLPVEAIDFTPPHVLWKQQENALTPLLKQEIP